jgi:uncharacterized protein
MSEDPFRLDYPACRDLLARRLAEPAPGRIQLLTGPRQVGKTTLMLQLQARIGAAAVYAAGDGPEAGLPGFWERIWTEAEEKTRTSGRAVLLIDEIQHLANWAERLKSQWDRGRRRKVPVHVVASGSSALRLGSGAKESLAGRFERLTLTHWSAAALTRELGVASALAADQFVRFGSYPGAQGLLREPERWRAYIRDAILEPAIGRDILALASVRRPALLRQVFGLCAMMPAQVVSLQKLQGQLQDRGALETIAHYLKLLEDAFLVVALEKYAVQPLRRRTAPPKLVVLNNALLAATNPQGVPDPAGDRSRFGRWVENACLAFAWNAGQRVSYWREEPLEVDGILAGSWGKWAVEIKLGPFDSRELRGLLEFCRRHPEYRPLVITEETGTPPVAREAGVRVVPWRQFLLHGPSEPTGGRSAAR